MKCKQLIIPYEVKEREIEGACRLSISFLKRGWKVYIGQKQKIFPFINQFKNSLWFLKSIVPGELSLLKRIKKNENVIMTQDIEGLATYNDKYGIISRFSKPTILLTDFIFFWGKNYLNRVKNFFKVPGKNFYCVGSPYADGWFLNKKKKKNKYNKKKILVATSFTLANSRYLTDHSKLALDNLGSLKGKEQEFSKNYHKKILKFYKIGFVKYKIILDQIFLKNKNFNFYLKPHPAENFATWKKYVSKFKNVYFEKEANLINSLKDKDLLIHYNSTSCFAAELNNINSYMFYPKKEYPQLFKLISNQIKQISNIVIDEKKILDLKSLLLHKKKIKKNYNIFENLRPNYSPNSSERIFKIVNKKIKFNLDLSTDIFNFQSYFNFFIYKLKNNLAFFFGHIGVRRFKSATFRSKIVSYYKFKTLEYEELLYLFKKISKNKFASKLNFKRNFNGVYKISIKK